MEKFALACSRSSIMTWPAACTTAPATVKCLITFGQWSTRRKPAITLAKLVLSSPPAAWCILGADFGCNRRNILARIRSFPGPGANLLRQYRNSSDSFAEHAIIVGQDLWT